MAVARDTSGQENSASFPSSPTTFSITIGANSNRVLFVWQGLSTTGTTGITYAGVSMTRIGNYTFSGGMYGSLWYLVAPATGTNNLVITHGGGDTFTTTYYSAYGVDQTTPYDTVASDITGIFGTTSTPSLPCASAVGDLVLGMAVLQYTATAWSATGTGSTARWVVGGTGNNSDLPANHTDHDCVTLLLDQTAAASTTDGGFSWTGSVNGVHVRFAIKAASGGGGGGGITLAWIGA